MGQVWIFFLVYVLGVFANLGDYYTTGRALSVGATEMNPVARWLIKKLGMALASFVSQLVFTAVAASMYAFGYPKTAIIYVAAVTGLETWMTIHNYRVYKAMKGS